MPLRTVDFRYWGEGQKGKLPLKLLRNGRFGHFLTRALFIFFIETLFVGASPPCAVASEGIADHQSKGKEGSKAGAPPAAKKSRVLIVGRRRTR